MPQEEAERFEKAIITTSAEEGRPGLIRLPGVTEIMKEVLRTSRGSSRGSSDS